MERFPCVYIMTNKKNGTLYTGVTNDVVRRADLHRKKVNAGFTKEHGLSRLVYVEFHETMESAIHREKQLKRWHRKWKLRLIEESNPEWQDLTDEVNG